MVDKKKLLTGATAMVALSSFVIDDAFAAKGSINMTAQVLNPLTVSQAQAMDFGNLTETGAGTVALDFADNATAGGSVTLAGGTPASGIIKITA
jgi:hypothetical protein